MKICTLIFVLLSIIFATPLISQTCPNNLIFYKETGPGGANLCVRFDSDPGVQSMVHKGITLNRVGNTNEYSNAGGNCNGNSLPNAAHSFVVNSLTCAYSETGSSRTVPVDLISFDYQNEIDHIKLTWSTASEINNDYFSVERMLENGTFEVIAKVNGHGNSSGKNSYQFTDRNPHNGINTYRLKQVDFNGNFEYSKVLSVPVNRDITFFQKSDMISIEYDGSATFVLYDITGRLIEKVEFTNTLNYDALEMKGKGMFVGTLISQGNQIGQNLFVF